MTAFLGRRDLCITMSAGAWEPEKTMSFKAGLRHVLRHCWLWPVSSFPRSCVGTAVPALLRHRADRRSGQALVTTLERGNQKKGRQVVSFESGLWHVLRHFWLWPVFSFPRSSVGTAIPAHQRRMADRRSGQGGVTTPERGNQKKP